jgi:hypothetical protein
MNVWIGLAHVQPKQGNELLEGAKGAFVPVLGLASTLTEFSDALIILLESYSFNVLEVEDIELYADRIKSFNIDSELQNLVTTLNESEPIVLSTFEAY